MKTCKKCNALLNDNDKFCNNCGADNSFQPEISYQGSQNPSNPKKNPMAALVVEGIGLFFILIGLFWLASELNKPELFRDKQATGPLSFLFYIGAILLIVSFILFKIYKKKEKIKKLEGLALAGYVISVIGLILTIIYILVCIAMVAFIYITAAMAMSQIEIIS